jgi:hypothetical protein
MTRELERARDFARGTRREVRKGRERVERYELSIPWLQSCPYQTGSPLIPVPAPTVSALSVVKLPKVRTRTGGTVQRLGLSYDQTTMTYGWCMYSDDQLCRVLTIDVIVVGVFVFIGMAFMPWAAFVSKLPVKVSSGRYKYELQQQQQQQYKMKYMCTYHKYIQLLPLIVFCTGLGWVYFSMINNDSLVLHFFSGLHLLWAKLNLMALPYCSPRFDLQTYVMFGNLFKVIIDAFVIPRLFLLADATLANVLFINLLAATFSLLCCPIFLPTHFSRLIAHWDRKHTWYRLRQEAAKRASDLYDYDYSKLLSSVKERKPDTPIPTQPAARSTTDPSTKPCAMYEASLLSQLYFLWVLPLLVKGYRVGSLDYKDLGYLKDRDIPSVCLLSLIKRLEARREEWKQTGKRYSLLAVMYWENLDTVLSSALCLVISGAGGLGSLFLIQALLYHLDNFADDSTTSYLMVLALFMCKIIESVYEHQFWIVGTRACIRMQASLVAMTAYKSLRLSPLAQSKFGVGAITNFMTVDARKIVDQYAVPMLHW